MGPGELSQRPPSPAAHPPARPLPGDPWLLPSAPVVQPWNPPRLSWLSGSLNQISFFKALHRGWMAASGSPQLDGLFLFSSESLLLPLISHQ